MDYVKQLETIIKRSVQQFENNPLLGLLNQEKLEMRHYQALLKTIYHQTFHSPITFAKAGINTPDRLEEIRLYLLVHAGEEKDHYKWIENDLKNTGFQGTLPSDNFPTPACLRYISLNYFAAERYPVARLGIASVLESFGANYGKSSAMKIQKLLNLKPNQLSFFFGHGDTDVGHTQDILDVLSRSKVTDEEWKAVLYFAEQAGEAYGQMYREAFHDAL